MENKTTKKPNGYWTREKCYEEANKYKSKFEFAKISRGAYKVACKNKWLDDYTWFERPVAHNKKWTREMCYEEAKKYTTRTKFSKGSRGAYKVACKNKWLDDYTWLKDERIDIINDEIDSVYVYEFKEQNYAYVGRTIERERERRHKNHIDDIEGDAVAKFAYENHLVVPEPIYLAENLTLAEGVRLEEYWEKKYREDGWIMLNRAKTGSIGALGKGKWNRKACYREAKKYTSMKEFEECCSSAYNTARKRGWLIDYTWIEYIYKPNGYWTHEKCYEEAQKYTKRYDFWKGSVGAYCSSLKHGWLDEFFPKKNKKVA